MDCEIGFHSENNWRPGWYDVRLLLKRNKVRQKLLVNAPNIIVSCCRWSCIPVKCFCLCSKGGRYEVKDRIIERCKSCSDFVKMLLLYFDL